MEPRPGKCAAKRQALIEDVEWMVSTGETHAESVAFRLGTTPKVLVRKLERYGKHDLIAQIEGRYSDIPACFPTGKRT